MIREELIAVKAYHENHGRMNGKGACSWVRSGEEHCDAWLFACESERLSNWNVQWRQTADEYALLLASMATEVDRLRNEIAGKQ